MFTVKGIIYLYKNGRKTPFANGYRPMFNINKEKFSGRINLPNIEKMKPGEKREVCVDFVCESVFNEIHIGDVITFGEGTNILFGEFIVDSIIHPSERSDFKTEKIKSTETNMEKDKYKIKFENTSRTFIIYKNKLCWYTGGQRLYHGIVYPNMKITIDDFINDENVYNKIINSEFNHIRVLSNSTGNLNSRDELVAYFKHRKEIGDTEVATYKLISDSDISAFYTFYLTVEIRALQLVPKTPNRVESIYVVPTEYDKKHICVSCCTLDSVNLNIGRRMVTNPWEDRDYVYLVPLKHIKKIKGTIRYKNNDWIGTDKESDYNEKTEEYILDLDHFDKDIYKVFTDHKMLEITNE